MTSTPKPRPCKNPACRSLFTPARMGQKACGVLCALAIGREANARLNLKKERAQDREKHESLKKLPELIAEAQKAFNAFIRARDAGLPCICCGAPIEPNKPGGSADCGHFRSRGAAPGLRFCEDNAFVQRKGCNRPGGTTYGKFRAGVIARIGLERTEAVEANNDVHKWTRDELIALKKHYVAALKALKSVAAGSLLNH